MRSERGSRANRQKTSIPPALAENVILFDGPFFTG